MILIVAAWLLWATVFGAIGYMVERPVAPGYSTIRFKAIGSGWAVVLLGLAVYQLLLPVDGFALILIFAIASLGLYLVVFQTPRHHRLQRNDAFRWALAALFTIGLALVALQHCRNGDSGAYHRPVIRWFETYRLVPGLNAIDPPQPFNSTSFLYGALVEFGPWAHRGAHIASSFLVWVLGLEIGSSVISAWKGETSSHRNWLRVIVGCALIDMIWGHDLASDSPDLAVAVVECLILFRLSDVLDSNDQNRGQRILRLVLLAALAPTLKLSAAVWGVLSVAVALAWMMRLNLKSQARRWATIAIAAFLVFGGAWVVRNIILTGYPLYPNPSFGLNVDWRIPVDVVQRVQNFIIAWGRWSGGPEVPVLGNWSWVRPWLTSAVSMNREFVLPVLAIVIGGAGLIARRRQVKGKHLLLAIPALGTIPFWFLTSPDFRFLGATAWCLVAALGAPVLSSFAFERWSGRASLACVVAFSILGVGKLPVPTLKLFVPDRAPTSPTRSFKTMSGWLAPVAIDGMCWDNAPPCLLFPLSSLELREPGKLVLGFNGNGWSERDVSEIKPDFWDAH